MTENLQLLQKWIDESKNMVFFGGAGVSSESGIPDFRSPDGLYNQPHAVSPETILSHGYFHRHTAEFFRFYKEKMLITDKLPNPAHKKLAQWQREGKNLTVITQNIDGLHQAAGSEGVLELHGTIHKNHCLRCGKFFDAGHIKQSKGIPKCECGGNIKPDVVLYGENLDGGVVSAAICAIRRADLLIIGGTSLTVYPAAGFIDDFRGDHLVLINREPTPRDDAADLVFRENIGRLFESLK